MTNRTRCTFYIGFDSWITRRTRKAHRNVPVRLEVVTEDGETFVLALERSAWSRLLNCNHEVDGWIEPLKGDGDVDTAG